MVLNTISATRSTTSKAMHRPSLHNLRTYSMICRFWEIESTKNLDVCYRIPWLHQQQICMCCRLRELHALRLVSQDIAFSTVDGQDPFVRRQAGDLQALGVFQCFESCLRLHLSSLICFLSQAQCPLHEAEKGLHNVSFNYVRSCGEFCRNKPTCHII